MHGRVGVAALPTAQGLVLRRGSTERVRVPLPTRGGHLVPSDFSQAAGGPLRSRSQQPSAIEAVTST